MNGLVGHHEAFADFSFRPSANLRRGILDFTNDKAGSVPVGQEKEISKATKHLKDEKGLKKCTHFLSIFSSGLFFSLAR